MNGRKEWMEWLRECKTIDYAYMRVCQRGNKEKRKEKKFGSG
jgi:hypothetical protein